MCFRGAIIMLTAIILLAVGMCSCAPKREAVPLDVPRGYLSVLRQQVDGKNLHFGPFVGYYFRPLERGKLDVLDFVCFNERGFYTKTVPENTLLFKGRAIRKTLPDVGMSLPRTNRINPIYFEDAPAAWLDTRPLPIYAFRHFHSAYNASGPVLTGYWFKHIAVTNFTYDMGRRVSEKSPLFHDVSVGVDTGFARIVEFDAGPDNP
jgi:hypothetical protein